MSALHHEVLAAMRGVVGESSAAWVAAEVERRRGHARLTDQRQRRRVACCLASLRKKGLVVRNAHFWSVAP